ncbi:MAG: SprT-like domain-containing protein [Hungatella sp.]
METVKPMEAVTSYPEASRYLEELFDQANAHYFDQELPKVVLTIQSSPRSYGHFTPDDRWHVEFDGKKEINIGAGTLDRSIKNVMATLIHEMTHYYCNLHGIKDTSRSHTYHNKSFKQEAETGGKQMGTDGDGSGGLRGDEGDTPKKKRSSTRKYECPMCLCSVRATSEVRILCMNCNRQMVVADRDPT